MASENTIELSDANFDSEVLKQPGTTLVDFWAPWCGPCRMVGPIVDEISNDYLGKVKVGKLNTDEAPGVATKYGIRSIPTLIIFKDGQPAEQIVGALPKDQITARIDKVLG